MGSLSGRRAAPSKQGNKATRGGLEDIGDPTAAAALGNIDILTPNIEGQLSSKQLAFIEEHLLPEAIENKDAERARLCEQVLAKYGRAFPNHVSGLWEPLEVPRNELQVRELFAARLPEYGYRLVASHSDFPDWLLLDEQGDYIYTEVEHRSSQFAEHGHNPRRCDLIACWEHDWSESPVPVLEFFSGQFIQPKSPKYGDGRKSDLQVNFSASLARYAPPDSNARRRKRREYAASRVRELEEAGVGRGEIMQTIGDELGVSRQALSILLKRQGASLKGRNRMDRTCARVQELVASGYERSEAIKQTAEEMDIKVASVYSTISRQKHKP